ncbi:MULTISPECIES: IclR family transcriptional regulator [Arthrobacter]|uniref:IclR family transcriptional regulator n=2 Tax=Arthrobacter TaxID=1663 RepID=A0ABU9KHE6_9MICC|nr:IclR family transcriptional regulator [Arthrobacter sp. YJM1]MDP5225783.1 IclR family transcriptional regulator [Arthrobacter sp. YJM1]
MPDFSTPPSEAGERNSSASLRKALRLVMIVAAQQPGTDGMALAELSEVAGVNKSTVLRLSSPLLDEKLLERDAETGRFRLGPGCLSLGQSYLQGIDLRSVARPELRGLMRLTQGTCHLVVLTGRDVVYVDKVEDEAVVRMASRIGATMPAYCTAVGKAMLAYSPEETVAEALAGTLEPVTDRTITDPVLLRAEFEAIRRRGYAIDDRENEPEVRCVAAPIFGSEDRVIAALSVSSLASRMTARRVRDVGPSAARAALRISARMGSRKAAILLERPAAAE